MKKILFAILTLTSLQAFAVSTSTVCILRTSNNINHAQLDCSDSLLEKEIRNSAFGELKPSAILHSALLWNLQIAHSTPINNGVEYILIRK